eukprot:4037798-Pleurochrysis_carterae.AAC.1
MTSSCGVRCAVVSLALLPPCQHSASPPPRRHLQSHTRTGRQLWVWDNVPVAEEAVSPHEHYQVRQVSTGSGNS